VDCTCALPPSVVITQANIDVCETEDATFNYAVLNSGASIPAGAALSHDGSGTLSSTLLADGTSTFTYTPDVLDIGSTVTINANIADPDGIGPCEASSDVATVTVNANPTVGSGGPYGDYCIDAGVQTLTGSPAGAGGVWTGTGISDNGDGTADFDPAAATAGTFTVTYTYTDPITNCTGNASEMITVNDLPTVTAGGPYADVCENGSVVNLTANVAGGVFSGTGVTDGAGATGTFDPSGLSGTITITYTFTDPITTCTNSGTTTINVDSTPPAPTVNSPITNICPAVLADLTANSTANGGGNLLYKTTNNPVGADVVDPTMVGVGSYFVFEQDPVTMCISSGEQIDVALVPCICVNPPLVVITEMDVIICDITTTTFNYTVSNGPADLTTTGAGMLSTTTLADGTGTFTYTSVAADYNSVFTITANIPDPDGSDPCVASTDVVNVSVFPNPTVSLSANPGPICENGGTVTITGSPIPGVSEMGVFTAVSGLTDNTDGTATFDPAISGAGMFNIEYTFTDANGCISSSNYDLEVTEAPFISSVTGTDPTFCGVEDGTLTVAWTGGIDPVEISIDGGANFFSASGASPEIYTNLAAGDYDVIVRNQAPNDLCPIAFGSTVNS